MIKNFLTIARRYFSAVVSLFLLMGSVSAVFSDSGKDSIAYKLAMMHEREEKPEDFLLKKTIEPPSALVAEFQWIMDSLKTRCLNPETAIADTIVESWSALKATDRPLSLLETARELASIAKNTNRFGNQKVNFRMTSQYWIKEQMAKKTGRK